MGVKNSVNSRNLLALHYEWQYKKFIKKTKPDMIKSLLYLYRGRKNDSTKY